MSVSSDTLYMKFSQNTEVRSRDIYFRDVAKFECTNKNVVNRLNATKLMRIPEDKNKRYVFSVLKIIEIIHEIYPGLTVSNLGDTDFIVTYEKAKKHSKFMEYLKVAIICVITFLGAGFSIMAFDNDAGTTEIFKQVYEWATGSPSDGFTILEITYAVGLMLGILVFFNHIGGRKLTVDPTPMEVQMRLYKDDLNSTLIEAYTREENYVDVGDTDFSGSSGS